MKVVFRVDASLEMGTGHVMRCLTLANAITAATGEKCHFICRRHPGNLIGLIVEQGHQVHTLPVVKQEKYLSVNGERGRTALYGRWLGTSQQNDARQTVSCMKNLQPDWLVVDHYALDAQWETMVAANGLKIMVIDDLADRPHTCDLLLDQTFGCSDEVYAPWVSQACTLLTGSKYALLRPEFAKLRPYSLKRRNRPELQHILVTMGGMDQNNATGRVLSGLASCTLLKNTEITAVMGANAPWRNRIEEQAHSMVWKTRVRVNVTDMAQLMADSDLCIGAAGSTAWERCCLGLPTLLVVLALNQRTIAANLDAAGAVSLLGTEDEIEENFVPALTALLNIDTLTEMGRAAAKIADGNGSTKVMQQMGISS